MISILNIDTLIDKNHNHYSSFLIEPLENGQAITLGNSLRRTLLSNITCFSTTAIKINNICNEFVSIHGIKEDLVDILSNIKQIVYKKKKNNFNFLNLLGYFYLKGPILVSSGILKLPKNTLQIINPMQHICTLTSNLELFLELRIEKKKNTKFQTTEKIKSDLLLNNISNILLIENTFFAIKKINYKVRIIFDNFGLLKESLFLEIITNGSILPKRAIQNSLKFLLNLFYPLINHKLLKKLSYKIKKKILSRLKLNIK